jgi:hypothetical protein
MIFGDNHSCEGFDPTLIGGHLDLPSIHREFLGLLVMFYHV